MHILAVCESPPTVDPRHANGSTLISHHLLQRLPVEATLDLVWFRDRPVEPSAEVTRRCATVECIDVVPVLTALASAPRSRLPLATARRTSKTARRTVHGRAADADVVYLHGLHTFGLAAGITTPVVAHEIDPWSAFWAERATGRGGARARYDRWQAGRASALEREVAALSHSYLVVNHDDADRLGNDLGRLVTAIPNGVDAPVRTDVDAGDSGREARQCVFAGTLDYAPNIDAATRLAEEIWPGVIAAVPDARLVIAGRRPTRTVRELAGPTIEVLADVDDLGAVLRGSAVAIFPGELGRGTKNTVTEAMAAGCAVVASPGSVRGLAPWPQLRVAGARDGLVAAVVDLLTHERDRVEAGNGAREAALALPSWDDAAAAYLAVLVEAAGSGARSRR